MDGPTEGLQGSAALTVTKGLTARAIGSGDLEVFGSPALLAILEEAACRALDGTIADDKTHVGVSVQMEHLASTKVGAQVRAEARLVSVDGSKLRFECSAFEGDKLIGRATHLRVVADRSRFE
ncbi:MAG: thioesterase family protein [Actinomycetota bacterium]